MAVNSTDEAFEDLHGLRQDFDELKDSVEQIIAIKGLGSTNSAASNININAGGIAVWAAVTACLVMLAVTIVSAIFVSIVLNDQGRQIGRAQDHLTAIYMMAPHLKPKENTDVIDNYYHHPAAKEAEAP